MFQTKLYLKNPKVVIGTAVIVVFFASIIMARGIVGQVGDDDRITPPEALASQKLNTKFEFPIRDNDNVEVAKVSYEIEKASLQNSFIYQGKLAKSVQGRTFLIFDLKITNPYEKGIESNYPLNRHFIYLGNPKDMILNYEILLFDGNTVETIS